VWAAAIVKSHTDSHVVIINNFVVYQNMRHHIFQINQTTTAIKIV